MKKSNNCIVVGTLAILLAVISILPFTACSEKADNNTGGNEEEVTEKEPPELVRRPASNPLLKGGDVPDPAVIRVGDAYYMVSTTMYFCPVAPIMKSWDLVNWKIVSYCADIIEDLPSFRLETEDDARIGEYGRGQWASSIRYYNGKFWVIFTNNTTNKSYLYSTENADKGPWTRTVIDKRFHDPSIFLDDDGKMYIFHGNGNILLTEMLSDLSGVKPGGTDKIILAEADAPGATGGSEGAQVYKRNGYYYVFFCTFGTGSKTQNVLRSTDIEGPYEWRMILNKTLGGKAVAQGGIVDTPDGDWYAFLFKEPNASGRVPTLVPMTWSADNWPILGDSSGNVPTTVRIKQALNYDQNLYASDEFKDTELQLAWQWNHNPDNDNWSLKERPGFLRIKTVGTSRTIYHARNTLTQRVFEPACEGTIALETTSMKDGDIAGLVLLQAISGFAGIEQDGDQKYIVMYTGDNENAANRGKNAVVTRREQVPFSGDKIYLKVNCTFRGNNVSGSEQAVFQYSMDGTEWTTIGTALNMQWTMRHFTGARFGLFNYATKEAGGYVDFDYFHVK